LPKPKPSELKKQKNGPAACGAAGPTIQQPTTMGTVSRNAKPRKLSMPWSAKKNLNRRLNVKKFRALVNLEGAFSKKQRLICRFENEKRRKTLKILGIYNLTLERRLNGGGGWNL
jgi:hypothetical protein